MSNKRNTNLIEKRDAPVARPAPLPWRNWIGVIPFFIFAFLFIILPSVTLLVGAFKDNSGKLTFANFLGLLDPSILNAYWVTIRISLVTAIGGGLLGFLMAYAVTVGKLPAVYVQL